jgi:hypothetical protein
MNFSRKYRIELLEEKIPGFSKCGMAIQFFLKKINILISI